MIVIHDHGLLWKRESLLIYRNGMKWIFHHLTNKYMEILDVSTTWEDWWTRSPLTDQHAFSRPRVAVALQSAADKFSATLPLLKKLHPAKLDTFAHLCSPEKFGNPTPWDWWDWWEHWNVLVYLPKIWVFISMVHIPKNWNGSYPQKNSRFSTSDENSWRNSRFDRSSLWPPSTRDGKEKARGVSCKKDGPTVGAKKKKNSFPDFGKNHPTWNLRSKKSQESTSKR